MNKGITNVIDLYYFPVFIFLVIITGDLDSVIRKVITFGMSSCVIFLSFLKFRSNNAKVSITTFLITLYLLICLLTVFSSVNPYVSFVFFFKTFLFFIIIASLYFWLDSYKKYKLLLKAIIIGGLFIAISIIHSVFFGNYITELEGNIRTGGVFSNVNTAGFICYCCMIFAYLQYLDKRKHILYAIYLLLLFIAIVHTGSRATLLALFTSILIYNLRFKLKKKVIIIFGFLISLTLISAIIYREKIINILRLDRGLSAREVLYETGIEIFKDYPYLGIGLGNLKEIGTIYIEKVEVSNWRKQLLLDTGIQSSHNVYIETALEIGIFGSITLILILLTIGKQYFKKNEGKYFKEYHYLFLAFFFGIFIRSFFESNGIINRGWITVDIFFWIMYIIFLRFETIKKSLSPTTNAENNFNTRKR